MRKIKTVTLKNCQAHADTFIELHPNINMFIGETHEGKTTIFRWLGSIYANSPNHEGMIRDEQPLGTASVKLDNDIIITKERNRNKGKNTKYFIETPKSDVIEKLDSFGVKVPQIISNTLKCPTFKVDNTPEGEFYLNISSQFDLPFLLTAKAPTRSKIISKLTGANVLDEAIKKNVNAISKKKDKREDLELEINSLTEKLKDFEYLDKSVEKIDYLLNVIKEFHDLKEKYGKLQQLILSYQENVTKLESLKSLVQTFDLYDMSNTIKDIQAISNNKKTHNQLNNSYNKYIEIINNISNLNIVLEKLTPVSEYLIKSSEYQNFCNESNKIEKINSDFIKNSEDLIQKSNINNSLFNIRVMINESSVFINKKIGFTSLNNLNEQYNKLVFRLEKGQLYLSKLQKAGETNILMQQYIKLFQDYNYFNSIVQSKDNLLNKHNSTSYFIKSLSTLSQLRDNISTLFVRKELINNLTILLNNYNKIDDKMLENEGNIIVTKKQIGILQDKLNQFEVCPLCEQQIKTLKAEVV